MASEAPAPLIQTGVSGLDHVLGGGLPADRLYLVDGNPGSGKTTLGLQFLLAGARRGESVLYVTLSETREEILGVARSHGWSLDGVAVHELTNEERQGGPDAQYTLFHPSEVELGETTKAILAQVEGLQPTRVVFDSLSEMRLLARDPLRYRRQILGLKQYFVGRRCTVLLLDDGTADVGDLQLRSLAHGVITMEHMAVEYGIERRRLRVLKLRGQRFRGGYHDFVIRTGGLEIFPRLVAADHRVEYARAQVPSGIAALDQLVSGGLDRGTSSLILGPAGSGKSTLAMQYAVAAAARDERSVIYLFDESRDTLLARAAGLGLPLADHVRAGRAALEQIDPAEIGPGELACRVRAEVEERGARLVVLDSLNGYLNSMPEERFLVSQLHELLTFLGHQGVVTLLIAAQHGLLGSAVVSPIDVSYLADTVLLLRYFEARGRVRQAISVVKKRTGPHERSIREFHIDGGGIKVGPPLEAFHGVLGGNPVYQGDGGPLMEGRDGKGSD